MTGRAYYNEIDPYAAAWLRNLISAEIITAGDVDERSIVDVRPADLAGYERCHFFAGIGVWDYALGLAGWPAGRPVWTASCPCQPFSAAGGRTGFADERHLWPAAFHLIRECRPTEFLGEQVASKDGLGWYDLVQADLEGEGYAVGAADLCAPGERMEGGCAEADEWLCRAILDCPDPILAGELRDYADWARGEISLGAPNIRQRLWFVAHADGGDASAERQQRGWEHGQQPEDGVACVLADATGERRDRSELAGAPGATAVAGAEAEGRWRAGLREPAGRGAANFWARADWIPCRDDKFRPVEPGSSPLVDGASFRLGSGSPFEGRSRTAMLKGFGNAINAQRAAGFIGAVLDPHPKAGGLQDERGVR